MQPTVELRKFVAPEFVTGSGARTLVGRHAAHHGLRRVLLVTDPGVSAAGWADEALEALHREEVETVVFDGVSPNPRDVQVTAGTELFLRTRCEGIVAVGGGSPIDCAKGIGIVAANGGHIVEYEGADTVSAPVPPLVCVPTTAGTSADVSQFAIILDTARKVKIAIVSKGIVPDISLIDPVPLTSMPAYLSGCTGMDALSHAVEAYVSNATSEVTDLLALRAIALISGNLARSIAVPDDLAVRSRVMHGSLEAGLAFSNASLGMVHAMAHALGGLLDLAHGECNALLLEHVVAFNFTTAPERYRNIAVAMGVDAAGMPDADVLTELVGALRRLRESVGIAGSLADRGVTRAALPGLAASAFADVCLVTNPRVPGAGDLEDLYAEAL